MLFSILSQPSHVEVEITVALFHIPSRNVRSWRRMIALILATVELVLFAFNDDVCSPSARDSAAPLP